MSTVGNVTQQATHIHKEMTFPICIRLLNYTTASGLRWYFDQLYLLSFSSANR